MGCPRPISRSRASTLASSGPFVFQADDCFKPANLFFPNFQRKRFKIKQIGRLKSVYLVQSLHAPHSK